MPYEPFSPDLEQAFLGSLLRDPSLIDSAAVDLQPVDLYDPFHQRLYCCICEMRRGGNEPTIATLSEAMRGDPDFANDGPGYLHALLHGSPVKHDLSGWVKSLKDLANRREMGRIGALLNDACHTDPAEIPTQRALGEATEALLRVGVDASRSAEPACTVAARVLDNAEAILAGGKVQFVTTGITKFDKACGGLQATDLIGIAARSGMGKTALLRNIALAAAMGQSSADAAPVLFFSKEMSADQITQGLLCDMDNRLKSKDEPGIEPWMFRAGTLSNYQIRRLRAAEKALEGLTLEICDDPDLSMSSLTARARAFQSRHKGRLGLVLVDYLQMITDDQSGRSDSRESVVSRLAAGHKRLAKLLEWPVCVAVQLKNKGDNRRAYDALPTAEDVRECVTGDTLVTCAKTGRRVRVDQLKPGARIFSLTDDYQVVPSTVSDVWCTGVKPVFEIVTKSGKRLKATSNHPVMTERGWIEVGSLTDKDRIVSAFRLPPHGAEKYNQADACRLLGYMAGNGTALRTPGFIIPDQQAYEDAVGIVTRMFPNILLRRKKTKYNDVWFSRSGGKRAVTPNEFTDWLRSVDAWGRVDKNKIVPDIVFQSGKVGAAEFLSGYLATDGCVSGDDIRFDTTSLQMAAGVQHLLAKLGICATVDSGYKSKKATCPIYRISVVAEHRMICAAALNVRGERGRKLTALFQKLNENPRDTKHSVFNLPEEAALEADWLGLRRHYDRQLTRAFCSRLAAEPKGKPLAKWVVCDTLWEDIRSITPYGEEKVYDLTVPERGCFLANGIVVHNSGAIEMNCDILVSPYRKAFFHKQKEPTCPQTNPAWQEWNVEMQALEHDFWLRGFKNRHGNVSALNLELWCDMGVGIIRDERPGKFHIHKEMEYSGDPEQWYAAP